MFLVQWESDWLTFASETNRKSHRFSCNISNTRKSVSSDIQTLRSRLKKRGAAFFFKRLRSVWISYETHFRVFDIASQMSNNSNRCKERDSAHFSKTRVILKK